MGVLIRISNDAAHCYVNDLLRSRKTKSVIPPPPWPPHPPPLPILASLSSGRPTCQGEGFQRSNDLSVVRGGGFRGGRYCCRVSVSGTARRACARLWFRISRDERSEAWCAVHGGTAELLTERPGSLVHADECSEFKKGIITYNMCIL